MSSPEAQKHFQQLDVHGRNGSWTLFLLWTMLYSYVDRASWGYWSSQKHHPLEDEMGWCPWEPWGNKCHHSLMPAWNHSCSILKRHFLNQAHQCSRKETSDLHPLFQAEPQRSILCSYKREIRCCWNTGQYSASHPVPQLQKDNCTFPEKSFVFKFFLFLNQLISSKSYFESIGHFQPLCFCLRTFNVLFWKYFPNNLTCLWYNAGNGRLWDFKGVFQVAIITATC